MIKVEIEGITDLMAFVAIIKGEELDLEKLKFVTKELKKATNVLLEAEATQPKV